MPVWRGVALTIALSLLNLNMTTCRSTADDGTKSEPTTAPEAVELDGVDTSDLTPRERVEWSVYVSELLAPCPDQPVSLVECVKERRPCDLCLPAARFLAREVRRGKTRSQAEAAFRIRFSPDTQAEVAPGDSPAKGAAGAAVVIVEWADFECPFCAAARAVLAETVQKYPGHVRLVFKHYPLSMHEHAETAARAAVAAGIQGKFWEMHEALFEHQPSGLDRKSVERIARDLGLDMNRFVTDLESEGVADAVARDRKQADALDLKGTPLIYINGRRFDLEHFSLVEDLDDWIQLEIESKTGRAVRPRQVGVATESAAPGSASPADPPAAASAEAAGG